MSGVLESALDDPFLKIWLRYILKQRSLNIHIPSCLTQTISAVEKDLQQNDYIVHYIEIGKGNDLAEFWLERR